LFASIRSCAKEATAHEGLATVFEFSASASSATPARENQATKEKPKLKRQQMSSLLSESTN